MHIQLRFDTAEAEWYGELRACPTMPACGVFPPHRHRHNVPLSLIVDNIKQNWPNAEVSIDQDGLIAYKLFKAMQYMGDLR